MSNAVTDAITLPANTISRADAEAVLPKLVGYERIFVQAFLDETSPERVALLQAEGVNRVDLTRTAMGGRTVVINTLLSLGRRALGL